MSRLRVLIVGASIAGPTAAYWFAKAGASVTVIERFPTLRTNGQNIDIRTVGVTVMRKMPGMEDAVRAKLAPLEGISLVRSNGQPYGTIRATGNPDQQSLVSEYEIFRGDLAQILYDMTKDTNNIRYVFGEQVTAIHQDTKEAEGGDGPVTVEFASGLPSEKFDLVVAADGATSRTRALALGCGVREHMHPVNAWAAYFTISKDLLDGSRIGHAYTAVGGRFIGVAGDPNGGNRVTLMGIYPHSSPLAMTPFREAVAGGELAIKRFIAEQFAGAGWKVDSVIEGMHSSSDFYATEMVQLKPPTMFRDRVVLIGDAGYAPGPTGMGTSLALVGAYVLAGEITRHKSDLEAGLRAYEDRMRPIVDELQKIPALVPTVFAPYTAGGLWLRNMVFAVICGTGLLGFVQRFSARAFASNEKEDMTLPEYEFGGE